MKRYTLFIYAALLSIIGTLPMSAQATQDALYIYRNDSKFHGFFYADIDHIEYSKIDTLGVEHDDYVVQEVYALDSVFRIPISAIKSVEFVTPETKYKDGVITPESNLWSYVVASDTLSTFTLSPSTPQELVPKVGDKLANTKATPYLPHGLYGEVASVTGGSNGTVVKCERASLSDLFERYVGKFAGSGVTSESGAARSATRNDVTPYEDEIPLLPIILGAHFGTAGVTIGEQMFSPDFGIKGEGTFMFKFFPTLKIRAFIDFTWLGDFNLDVTTRLEAKTDYLLDIDAELSFTKDIGVKGLALPLGQTPFFLEYEPGITFGISGSIKVNQDWHNVTSAYGLIKATNLDESEGGNNQLIGSIHCVENQFLSSAYGSLSLNAGIYSELNFTLVTKDYARLGIRFESGLKTEVSTDLNMLDVASLISPSLALLNTLNPYKALNKDGAFKIGPYAQGKIIANVFNFSKDFTFFDDHKGWLFEGGIVPKYPTVRWEPDPKKGWRGRVVSYITRKLISPLTVGQALFETSKMEFYNEWINDTKYKNAESFTSYAHDYEFLQPGKKYRVYPTVHLGQPFLKPLLADTYVDFTLGPPAFTFKPDKKFEVSPYAGSRQVEVMTNMFHTEMQEPKDAPWLTASYIQDDADLKFYYDDLPDDIDERNAFIYFIGRDSTNTNILKKDSIEVIQIRPVLKVSPKEANFKPEGGKATIMIQTNLSNVKASILENGYDKFYSISLNADKTLTVTVPENKEERELSGAILVTASSSNGQKLEEYVYIKQEFVKTYNISAKPETAAFDPEGGTQQIAVTTNVDWGTNPDKLKLSDKITGGDGWLSGDWDESGENYIIKAAPNESAESRSATITFLLYNDAKTVNLQTSVTVTQAAIQEAVKLTVSPKTVKFNSEGGETDIEYATNASAVVISIEDSKWLSWSQKDNGVITLKAKTNDSGKDRENKVTFRAYIEDKEVAQATVIVKQTYEPILSVNPTSYQFKKEGGQVDIEIKHNSYCTIGITDRSWLDWVTKDNEHITLTAAANEGEERENSVIVTLVDKNDNELTSQTVTIKQEGSLSQGDDETENNAQMLWGSWYIRYSDGSKVRAYFGSRGAYHYSYAGTSKSGSYKITKSYKLTDGYMWEMVLDYNGKVTNTTAFIYTEGEYKGQLSWRSQHWSR